MISKYYCFEQGPIRPPSEAQSLLLRVTRNCPWNRCTFCPVYKGKRFSVRPVGHVKKDIDSVHRYVDILKNMAEKSDHINRTDIVKIAKKTDPDELRASVAAFKWFSDGMRSVFIQDANSIPLCQDYIEGRFQKCTEIIMVKEILMFIEKLDGLTSVVKSDHILNLFEDLEGTLPQDKEHMTNILKDFLAMPPEKQCLYQVGRRLGIFSGFGDMENSRLAAKAEDACIKLGINPENVDEIIDEMMKRFV